MIWFAVAAAVVVTVAVIGTAALLTHRGPGQPEAISDEDAVVAEVRGYVDDLARIDLASAAARYCAAAPLSQPMRTGEPHIVDAGLDLDVVIDRVQVARDVADVQAHLVVGEREWPLPMTLRRRTSGGGWCVVEAP